MTTHEWLVCEDCIAMHCVDACPVPIPVYVSLDPEKLAAVTADRMQAAVDLGTTSGHADLPGRPEGVSDS
jgi:hypothetical protein